MSYIFTYLLLDKLATNMVTKLEYNFVFRNKKYLITKSLTSIW